MSKLSQEWRVQREVARAGGRDVTALAICIAGPRGVVHRTLFKTSPTGSPHKLELLTRAATVAAAGLEMQRELEEICAQLDRNEPITIKPLSPRHIAIAKALLKARGER